MKIAAIVVGYFPDETILLNLIRALSAQVTELILVDNGGSEKTHEIAAQEGIKLKYINVAPNKGLGYALNAGFIYAESVGATYVATFDQDSAPSSDLITKLELSHQKLEAQGINCAAVGPVFYDRREGEKIYFPFYREENGRIVSKLPGSSPEELVETDALITSGMLVKIKVWAEGTRYDDGLFVDYTETDWCYRVRSKGYKLYGNLRTDMGHAPSDAPPLRILGLSFFRYSPLRRYYYFRNTVSFCRQPYVSWAWRRRILTGLTVRLFVNALIDTNRIKSVKMMVTGIRDSLRNKTGEYSK